MRVKRLDGMRILIQLGDDLEEHVIFESLARILYLKLGSVLNKNASAPKLCDTCKGEGTLGIGRWVPVCPACDGG